MGPLMFYFFYDGQSVESKVKVLVTFLVITRNLLNYKRENSKGN